MNVITFNSSPEKPTTEAVDSLHPYTMTVAVSLELRIQNIEVRQWRRVHLQGLQDSLRQL